MSNLGEGRMRRRCVSAMSIDTHVSPHSCCESAPMLPPAPGRQPCEHLAPKAMRSLISARIACRLELMVDERWSHSPAVAILQERMNTSVEAGSTGFGCDRDGVVTSYGTVTQGFDQGAQAIHTAIQPQLNPIACAGTGVAHVTGPEALQLT
jgi:hypothetical protein